MNLSVIERMARTGDMSHDAAQYLVRCKAECEWLDYKELLSLENDKQLCDFTRDAVAIKNTGGGYIVVGVEDKTWELKGLHFPLPYDAKQLRDKIRKCSGLEIEADIVHHDVSQVFVKHRVALIHIRASAKRRKRRVPTLIMHDFCAKESFGVRRGEIYFRQHDSTVRLSSAAQLEELLDDLESTTDDEARRLVDAGSVFAIEQGLNRLLEPGYDKFIGRTKLRADILQAVLRDPRIWIINVHGPGGVGKSALVNYVAQDMLQQKKFESIIQLTAKSTALTQAGILKINRNLYSLENLLDQILMVFEENSISELQKKKSAVIEILSAFSMLLVLDNMETVTDGRILNFVQELPVGTRAKVLLTSRSKTGGWELPIPVNELNRDEVAEFVSHKREELDITEFPTDEASIDRVARASGGLPLAIQWIIGRFKKTRNLGQAVGDVSNPDSPVLEFSFRNIWTTLTAEAKETLATLTIFESPPTIEQIAIATAWKPEKLQGSLDQLKEVTLITPQTHPQDGRVVYTMLPITASFARIQLAKLGGVETECRRRYQQYTDQINLHEHEVAQFKNIYNQFEITNENTRRAVILCRRAESEMFSGNSDAADGLFKQARDLAPNSSYILAMNAFHEINRNRLGFAIEFAQEAVKRASKKTGKICYNALGRALEMQNDKIGAVAAFQEALKFDENDSELRFRCAKLFYMTRKPETAIQFLTNVIERLKSEQPARLLILDAYKLRVICYRRTDQQDLAERDIISAKDVLSRSPHLSRSSYLISSLEND